MRKIFLITLMAIVYFLAEFIVFNNFGRWFTPNLLLLLIIFINFAWGVRFSIYTAAIAGFIKDSFSVGIFGVNVLSFVACAYITTIARKRIYSKGSKYSLLLVISLITFFNDFINCFLNTNTYTIDIILALRYVFIPNVITTIIVALAVFSHLRKCVLRLSV